MIASADRGLAVVGVGFVGVEVDFAEESAMAIILVREERVRTYM